MRRENGSVMVVTLAILATLVAILVSMAATQHVVAKAEVNRMEERQSKFVVQAGLQRVMQLMYQITNGTSSTTSTSTSSTSGSATTLQDDWALFGTNGDEKFIVGNASFRCQIIDANSLLNVNTIPEAQLDRLPLTQEQIDSLLDWRETSTTPRADGGKDEFYTALTTPYIAKLGRLNSLDELLNVKGFTAKDIYEASTNQVSTTPIANLPDGRQATLADLLCVEGYTTRTRTNGQALLNVNANVPAQQLIQNLVGAGIRIQDATIIANAKPGAGYTSIGQICALPGIGQNSYAAILDNLTTSAATRVEGKINLNTATEAVLDTIPNMTTDIAQGIISRQSQGFTAMSDMLSVPGLNSGTALRDLAGYFTVQSNTFLVRIMGMSGSFKYCVEAVIDIQNGTPKILRMVEQPFSNMQTRWGWHDSTTTDTVLVETHE